jgi:hypothetical protein
VRRDTPQARYPISDAAIAGLARRGLVEKVCEDAAPRFQDRPRLWSDVYRVSAAGKLMVMLLAEAGFTDGYTALDPPPPPGVERRRPVVDVSPGFERRPGKIAVDVSDGHGGWVDKRYEDG